MSNSRKPSASPARSHQGLKKRFAWHLFHMPLPIAATKECYLANKECCKQLLICPSHAVTNFLSLGLLTHNHSSSRLRGVEIVSLPSDVNQVCAFVLPCKKGKEKKEQSLKKPWRCAPFWKLFLESCSVAWNTDLSLLWANCHITYYPTYCVQLPASRIWKQQGRRLLYQVNLKSHYVPLQQFP